MLGPWAVAGQAALAAAMSKQGWTWATVPVNFEAYWAYGALDPVLTAMIAERLWPKIQDQRHMYDIEIGAIMVMRDAELRGMHIDLPYVYNKTAEMQSIMHENRPLIPDEIKNPGSDAQVLDYLRSKGAHLWKKTEKDNWSCDDDVLKEQEAANIPGAAAIRTWRRANWLENNYWRNMRNLHVDSVLRPSIKPVGARTSRMSITQPALQTIPRGNEVRNAFTAREGHSLIMCDYKQLELRIMAYDAQEPTMLEAIRNGEDLHNTVADQIYPGGWDSEGRQVAKNVNFAKGYVAGVKTFAHTAGLSMERAQKIFDDYDLRFPRIQDWQDKIIEDAKVNKYVTTLWGRRIPVNKGDEYKGVNWRIQATATSDLTKLKIIECSNHGLHDYFLLPVHDELIFEAPDDIVQDVAHEVQSVMTETQLFPGCPLNVDASIHKMWEGK